MRGASLPLCALAVLAACLTSTVAHASWITDGNPVCTAAGSQLAPTLLRDGSGGALILWADSRRGATSDLYAQHLLADGTFAPGWAADGVLLVESATASGLCATTDDAGGALVFWYGGGGEAGVHMQHLLADGTIAPGWPANGKLVTTNFGAPIGGVLRVVPDGAGGAYVLRAAGDAFMNSLLRLTRVTSSGAFASGWTEDGVLVTSISSGDGLNSLSIAANGSDGVIIEYTYYWSYGPPQTRYSSRVMWVSAAGAVSYVSTPGPGNMAFDQSGGCFVTGWNALMQGNNFFGRHLAANMSALWTLDTGLSLRGVPFADGAGGFYIAGADTNSALVLQRRLSDGSLPAGWTPTGLVLNAAPWYSGYAYCRTGSNAVICWTAGPGIAEDVRAVIVQPDGTIAPGWSPNGTVICGAAWSQSNVRTVSDDAGGAFVCWVDPRTDLAHPDLYATRIVPDGPVPAQASVAQAVGYADHAELRWYAPAMRGSAVVERSEDGAAWTELATIEFDAEGSASFTDAAVLPGQRYGYRLRQPGGAVWSGSEAWLDVPLALSFGVRALAPNPARASVSVAFALGGGEPARLELLDVSGRVLQRHAVAGAPSAEHRHTFALDREAQGVFWVRLTQGARTQSRRVAHVR